ncbi:MAG TPA: septation protein IspZ, partial [Rhodoferax sp.]|nr:septation protein IspZ [Rhodoferax sp.]
TAFMAILNGYVVLYYSTEAWVAFKLWGYVFPLAFIIGQGIYIAPHIKTENNKDSTTP